MMKYLGGKYKIRKQVSAYLESVRGGMDYVEPFVGSANIISEMSGNRTAYDNSEHMITLWNALKQG